MHRPAGSFQRGCHSWMASCWESWAREWYVDIPMTSSSDRIFFRVVHGNPPSLADVTSPAGLGKPYTHPDPSLRRLWIGISCYATETQARRNAQRFRTHGAYIAAIRIEDGAPVRIEKTLGPGHYTLWGFPADLLERVIAVISVW
jgi:hypothetical protein